MGGGQASGPPVSFSFQGFFIFFVMRLKFFVLENSFKVKLEKEKLSICITEK